MTNSNQRNLYVGVVPEWLNSVLTQRSIPLDTALSFEKLATTISPEEVGFYYAYNMHFDHYMGNDFDDMSKLYELPENIVWLNNNREAVQRAVSTFKSAFSMNASRLNLQSTPLSIRQTNYRAEPASDTGILLVGCGPHSEYSRSEFLIGCCKALEAVVNFDEYKHLKIFSVYTRHR